MHTKPRRGSELAPRPRREHQPGASKPRRAWSTVESSTLLHVKIRTLHIAVALLKKKYFYLI